MPKLGFSGDVFRGVFSRCSANHQKSCLRYYRRGLWKETSWQRDVATSDEGHHHHDHILGDAIEPHV